MRAFSLLAAGLLALAASPAAAQPSAPYADLPGTSWIMIEWNGEAPPTPWPPVLAFGRDRHFAGRAGCNTYSGPFRVSGERIEFEPSAWTKMMCAPDRMALDRKVAADWRRVRRLTLGGDGILAAHAEDGSAIFRFRRGGAGN